MKIKDENIKSFKTSVVLMVSLTMLLSSTVVIANRPIIKQATPISDLAFSQIIYVPNDYPTIQGAINAAANGDTIFVYSGFYHENIVVNKSIILIGENKDTTIIDGNIGTVITVLAAHVQISRFTLQNSGGCGGSGISVQANYTNITNIITSGCNREGISINHGSYTQVSSSTIRDGQCGIWITESSYVTITENQIYNNTEGIEISEYDFPSPNCVISKNTIEHNDVGLLVDPARGCIITDNIFIGDSLTLFCLHPEDANTHTIEGNTVNGRPLRYYKNMQGVTVPQNTGEVIVANCSNISIQNLAIHGLETSVEVLFCTHAIITGNSVSASNFILFGGFLIQNSSDIKIENNQITDGMVLLGSQGCTVSVNTFNIAHEYSIGLFFWGTSYSTISQNTFTSSILNQGVGIGLEQSTYNQITKNQVENIQEGIMLMDQSNYNTFTENTLTNNSIGFDIIFPQKGKESVHLLSHPSFIKGTDKGGPQQYPCYNNTIYHNNFIANTQQAYDASENNWDNGYSSGGNYWSDYTGGDGNGDGIGDTPYNNISGKIPPAQDRYPLFHPFVLGDMNVDGVLDNFDIKPFTLALTNPTEYRNQYHLLASLHGDINQDGTLDNFDIKPFIRILTSG